MPSIFPTVEWEIDNGSYGYGPTYEVKLHGYYVPSGNGNFVWVNQDHAWFPKPDHRFFYEGPPDKRWIPSWVDLGDYGWRPGPNHVATLRFEEWAEELDKAHWLTELREKWGLVEGQPKIKRDYELGEGFNEFAERYGAR